MTTTCDTIPTGGIFERAALRSRAWYALSDDALTLARVIDGFSDPKYQNIGVVVRPVQSWRRSLGSGWSKQRLFAASNELKSMADYQMTYEGGIPYLGFMYSQFTDPTPRLRGESSDVRPSALPTEAAA